MNTLKPVIKKLVSPWEDNPSKPENFYGTSVKEEMSDAVEEETDINEEAESIQEKVSEVDKSIESEDPYYLILKDLKE